MKKNVFILLINTLLFFSCVNTTSNVSNSNENLAKDSLETNDYFNPYAIRYAPKTDAGILDLSIFLLKNVKETFALDEKFSIVKNFQKLTEEQAKAWIEPIPDKFDYLFEFQTSYRAVAIQQATDKYYLLLLMICEAGYTHNTQFIVSVDKEGRYIDALAVAYAKSLSNWDIEFDEDRSIYTFNTLTTSFFDDDYIRVVNLSRVSNLPDSSKAENYWLEWYETIYSVTENGHIVVSEPRRKIAEER